MSPPLALSLRKRLLSSRTARSYGPMLLSSSPTLAELLSGLGYGHIIVDMEHSSLDIATTADVLRAIDAASRRRIYSHHVETTPFTSTAPLVRLPSRSDFSMTKHVLDALVPPGGILFPMIESESDAEAAVEATRCPERGGIRGSAHPYVRASSYGADLKYFHEVTEDLLVAVQVESANAVKMIPAIAAVEGIDCIFLGPLDISSSIDQVGQFQSGGDVMKLLREAECAVMEAAAHRPKEQRLVLGGFRSPGRSLKDMFDCGYQIVCGGADLGLLSSAAMNDVRAANRAIDKSEVVHDEGSSHRW